MPRNSNISLVDTFHLGRAIKIARVRNGWNQKELAKQLGVSTTYISLLERDKRDPSWSFVKRLAAGLGVPLPVLLLLGGAPGPAAKSKGSASVANELLALAIAAIGRDPNPVVR